MNITSSGSSSYVAGASSNKGFSGLASGIDTESMVEAMLSGTQSKIDKQNGLKQQLEWKQEIYRDIINQINAFQSKFFGTSSTTGLLNQSFYNSMKALCSSGAFGVTANSSAATGSTKFQIRQLATNSSITSGKGVSGKLNGKLDVSKMQELVNKELGGTTADEQNAAYTVKFQVGSDTVEVNLRDIFVSDDGKTFKNELSQKELDAAIEKKLNDAFSGKGVTAQVKDGAMTLSTGNTSTIVKVASGSGKIGLNRLGLTEASSSTVDNRAGKSVLSSKVSDIGGLEFTVTLDDVAKNIRLDWRDVMTGGSLDTTKFQTALQAAVDNAHGAGQVTVQAVGGDLSKGFELQVATGRKVMVGGSAEAVEAFGWLNGQSNRIGMGGKLSQLYFGEKLQGSEFRFSINGVDFHFTEDNTMSEIVSAINRSGAGVRLIYRTQDDTFTLESTDSGAGRSIRLEQTEGNLLNALFGSGADGALKTGSSASSKTLTSGTVKGGTPILTTEEDFKEVKQGTFKLMIDGKEHVLTLPKKSGDAAYTKDEIITELNKQLDDKFGAGNIHLSADGSSISVKNGMRVSVVPGAVAKPDDAEALKKAAKGGDLALALFGAKEVSNSVTGDTTLGDLGITGLKGADGRTLGADVKLSELNTHNPALSFENGKIRVDGSAGQNVADAATMKQLFGVESLKLGVESGKKSTEVKGQNAIVEIDGLVTERSSNNFTVNGLNFNLKETTGTYEAASGILKMKDNTPFDISTLKDGQYIENGTVYNPDGSRTDIAGLTYEKDGQTVTADGLRMNGKKLEIFNGKTETIQVTRNTDQIVEGIKSFVDEYNKLIKTLNDYLDEDTSYKKYPPLTEAQKKEMSEKEIELWEKKAKEGLLHRDSTIDAFLQSMRTTLYEKPEGCPYALYDLGIETGEWESKGQLVFTADSEAKLRQILESDPESVMKLFTDSENGIFTKINRVIDETAKVSSGSPGALVELAGIKGKVSEKNNTLYEQIKSIDDRIAVLKRTYEKQKNRYWSEFNTMEQLISNMNVQSSWLSQQFSTM